MPKVPNRRHTHHLSPEDQRTAFIQAVRNVGFFNKYKNV
jgi:hypothetical protein